MVRQEIWGTLIAHFIIRKLIFEAAEIKKVSPSEISFIGAFDILLARLPDVPRAKRTRKRWYKDLLNEIAEEQSPPRANRINPRKLKKRSKAWPTKRDRDRRPPKPNGKFVDCVHISI
jgi:hypothetical protein